MTDEYGDKILIISNTPLRRLIPLSSLIQPAPTVFARPPLRTIPQLPQRPEPLVRPQAQPLLHLRLPRVVVRVPTYMVVREDMQGWGLAF